MEYWDGFDTSHWKTTDKAWMAERKQQWLEIEKLLYVLDKNKKARSIIKQYFLKGQLPDWKKLHDWSQGSTTRHLDLLLFLYLHPSRDDAVLRPLRDQFMDNPHARWDDRLIGFNTLWQIGLSEPASGSLRMFRIADLEKELPQVAASLPPAPEPYADCRRIEVHTDGQNERLFNLMWPDITQQTVRLPVTRDTYCYRALRYTLDYEDFPLMEHRFTLETLWIMSQWLVWPTPLNRGSSDMIFQYEQPMNLWYHHCAQEDVPEKPAQREFVMLAVYRIFHFDVDQEGPDSPRTRFVRRARALLTERSFSDSFRALIALARSGDVVVSEPWNNDAKVLVPAFYSNARGAC